MLINCKYCDSKFAVNAEEVGFDGRLIKCENCKKEWFQESKSQSLEKKLIELDQNLHSTEVHLIEKKNTHNDKIAKLENALKIKKEELAKQKLLEERISLFEKRITDTEKEIAAQTLVENRITQLEKEIKQNSFDSFVKNTNLEKKANYLQRKIHSEGINDRLDNLENDVLDAKDSLIKNEITDSEKPNLVKEIKIKQNFKEDQISNVKEIKKNEVIDTKKSNKLFFWNRKKKNTTPVKKNLDSSKYGTTHTDTWDLSEETIERELQELRKRKKDS
jgi:predicted Zn finger-like uncharacterized protein